MVSHPETGSDPQIGSDRDRGRDSRGMSLPFAFFFCKGSHQHIDSCHGRVIQNQQYLFPIYLLLP